MIQSDFTLLRNPSNTLSSMQLNPNLIIDCNRQTPVTEWTLVFSAKPDLQGGNENRSTLRLSQNDGGSLILFNIDWSDIIFKYTITGVGGALGYIYQTM